MLQCKTLQKQQISELYCCRFVETVVWKTKERMHTLFHLDHFFRSKPPTGHNVKDALHVPVSKHWYGIRCAAQSNQYPMLTDLVEERIVSAATWWALQRHPQTLKATGKMRVLAALLMAVKVCNDSDGFVQCGSL